MPEWTPTLRVVDLDEGPRRFESDGRAVLVAMVDGRPHAVADACLHKGVSLEGGVCKDGFISCPSHWWRYDLRDGALQGSPGESLATYPCRVVDGVVEVELPDPVPTLSLREQLLAHARAGRTDDA